MAYNRYYQYDTNPRKLEPEYEPVKRTYPKKSTAKSKPKRISRVEQAKKHKVIQRKIICYIAICFAALFIISYRYSMIYDTYAELKKQKDTLAVIQKESTQLEANIESSLNLKTIEEEAKAKLGMQQLTAEQTAWVSVPKTDHVETASEEVRSTDLEESWFMKIVHKIIQSFN